MLFPMDYKTMALLAIVSGLVILCMGLWYVWNTQQMLGTEVRYLRNQHIAIQEQLKKPQFGVAAQISPKRVEADVMRSSYDAQTNTNTDANTTDTTQKNTGIPTIDADSVLHRSYQMVNSANDVSHCLTTDNNDQTESSSTEDDDTEASDFEEFDDDDQNVDTTDLVNHNHTSETENIEKNVDATTNEDTNHLVESILSNIVSESVEQQTAVVHNASVETTDVQTDDSVNEDFLENSGNYNALADSLRKKTVVELKKMCADYQIGIKKGKTFLKKEELIEELVVKMPVG